MAHCIKQPDFLVLVSPKSYFNEALIRMLYLSEILIQNPDLESFEQLLSAVQNRSKSEMFFRIDVKPQYQDTPEDWEDRLEAAFT